MAKTAAERARAYMIRKRAGARELGLCGQCCKEKPSLGNTICAACHKITNERKKRKRKRDREISSLHQVLVAHERAGDVAQEHHLYEDAVQHYQDALELQEATWIDRARISEKLAYALSLGRDPQAAAVLFDRMLARYRNAPTDVAKTVEILLQRARQLWIDTRINDAIPLLAQAVEMAEANGDAHLRTIANSRMADYLIGLSR